MYKQLRQKTEGFTIIEVLIVLAIAGLILLVVFLAVPALQRNQRNNARNSDGALIAAAVNECLGNRNGITGSCNEESELPLDKSTSLGQLNTSLEYKDDIEVDPQNPEAEIAGTIDSAVWSFGKKCSLDGSTFEDGTARQFVVLYQIEDQDGEGIQRCLQG